MTKQISVLKSDILAVGQLGNCVSMLMGVDFEFLVGDCVDPSSETKKAYKYQSHSVIDDYRTAITDVVLDVIHNPSVPLLDAWFDSEEGFLAALICQVSERSELANMASEKHKGDQPKLLACEYTCDDEDLYQAVDVQMAEDGSYLSIEVGEHYQDVLCTANESSVCIRKELIPDFLKAVKALSESN